MQCSRKRFTSTCAQRDYASCRGKSMRRRKPSRRSRGSISEQKEVVEKLERKKKRRRRRRKTRRRRSGKKTRKEWEKKAKSLKLTYYNRANNCDLRSIRRHLVSRMQFVSFFFFFLVRDISQACRGKAGERLCGREHDNKCLILLIIMRHDDWCF